jgi:hypothetical protein
VNCAVHFIVATQGTRMMEMPKPGFDCVPHSKPGSVDQQMEDTFPASDPPSFSSSVIGAPHHREPDDRRVRIRRNKGIKKRPAQRSMS